MKQIVCITAGCMFFALMLSACRTPATQLKEEQNMGNQMIIETCTGRVCGCQFPKSVCL